MLGTRGSRAGAELLTCCPACAHDRMKTPVGHVDEITFVQELHGDGGACAGCGKPLGQYRRSRDVLGPVLLMAFMGRVLQMAERQMKAGRPASAADLASTLRRKLGGGQ